MPDTESPFPRMLTFASAAFGVLTVGSGIYNRLVDHGTHGLWFGLVFGDLALLGSTLCFLGRPRIGFWIGTVAVTFVGGWFLYETFAIKGGAASWRHYLMVVGSLTYGAALLAVRPRRRQSASDS